MQIILSIDFSVEPACLQSVEVDGRSLRILESYQMPESSLFQAQASQHNPPANGASRQAATLENSGNAQTHSAPADQTDEELVPALLSPGEVLKQAIAQIKSPWTNSILLVPPYDYLALNVDLPFGDQRNINKILDLEVQDQVPFDLSEFLLEYRALGRLPNQSFDIHVSLIPRRLIENSLNGCRQAELEPIIITTPTSALEALFVLGAEYFAPNAAVILERDPNFYILVRADNESKCDRVIAGMPPVEMPAPSPGSTWKKWDPQVVTELKLTLAVADSRYQRRFEQVYLISQALSAQELQQNLGRNVESVNLRDLLQAGAEPAQVAGLAALFAQDQAPLAPLTNFRAREFTYRPQLREVLLGLRQLVPYLITVLSAALVSLAVLYYSRENQIWELQNAMRKTVQSIIPDAELPKSGKVYNFIYHYNEKLSKDLGELAPPSKFTPLDAFLEVIRDLKNIPELALQNITIKGNLVKFNAIISSQKDIDTLERIFQRKRNVYCRKPALETQRLGSTNYRVTLEVRICE